jgi:hypothetical protein
LKHGRHGDFSRPDRAVVLHFHSATADLENVIPHSAQDTLARLRRVFRVLVIIGPRPSSKTALSRAVTFIRRIRRKPMAVQTRSPSGAGGVMHAGDRP